MLLIIGDSITLGAAETLGQEVVRYLTPTYVDRLGQLLPDVKIMAEGGVHRTTTEGAAELPGMLKRHVPDVVLLMLGGNDAELNWKRFVLSDGAIIQHKISMERYRENLEKMIHMIRLAGAVPVVSDFPGASMQRRAQYVGTLAKREIWPMIERKGGAMEWRRRVGTYTAVASDVATRTGATGAWYAAALNGGEEMYCDDGAHPNEAGHGVIAEVLAPQLSSVLAFVRPAALARA
ncbi:MAG TPA: GDSL-type esterase/lipase family protein [Tepidisphaeraceae bacterium]|nr:GDSL-type esterase/lipase family protein [Tepidisphaeraceae bacterium]